MFISIDGACKRNGTPECSSIGVAWITTEDGEMLYKSKFETKSTSQRGEINGLVEALNYAAENAARDEDIVIVTDSEYLHNTIEYDWLNKWAANNWVGAQGHVKNADLWQTIQSQLIYLRRMSSTCETRVFLQWTKGHIVHYTPGNIKFAMQQDPTGIELFTRIQAMANRPADIQRIINDFADQRKKHDKTVPPPATCLEWAIANAQADALASYLINLFDSIVL